MSAAIRPPWIRARLGPALAGPHARVRQSLLALLMDPCNGHYLDGGRHVHEITPRNLVWALGVP